MLVGDFNATLDNDTLRDVLGQGYMDAADARGAGLVPTWPAGAVHPPVTIDHVIADERAAVLEYETAEIPRLRPPRRSSPSCACPASG